MTKDEILKFITVHPRELAHCKICWEPLYIIYDQSLRSYCYDCTQEMKATVNDRK